MQHTSARYSADCIQYMPMLPTACSCIVHHQVASRLIVHAPIAYTQIADCIHIGPLNVERPDRQAKRTRGAKKRAGNFAVLVATAHA